MRSFTHARAMANALQVALFHVSEHHGVATPGAVSFQKVQLKRRDAELEAKRYPNLSPGLEMVLWGGRLIWKQADMLRTTDRGY